MGILLPRWRRCLAAGLALSAVCLAASAQKGYEIEVEIDGFSGSEAYLANYFMDKQYIVDTSAVDKGRVVFRGDEKLAEGTYLLVLPPDNDYTLVQIDGDQHFKLRTTAGLLTADMKVKGSVENELFYDYLHFIAAMRPVADSLRAIQADSSLPAATREVARAEGERVDGLVRERQESILSDHANTITASVIRSMREPEMPEFAGDEEEVQRQRYLHYKRHYFDNVDLGDPRALRSSYLDQRVGYYLDKLVVPVPDSINRELDFLLDRMRPSDETFRFYLSKFFNEYAASKVVGMDAVYAHLGEKYYMSGEAHWVDSTTLAKIADNVTRLKPLLIGQRAPGIKVQARDKQAIDLDAIDSDYTVLFFFDPECGHCQKQTPHVVDFARDYKDKGVAVVSVCSKFAPDQDSCWSYVDSKEGMAENLYNGVDPYHRSKYKIKYDIKSFPQIYVLDRDKTILSKRIGAEQLPEVLDRIIAMRDERDAGGAGGDPPASRSR